MIYVIYDTNVIVSSFLKINSIPAKVIDYSFTKNHLVIPIYNNDFFKEYGEVLRREKFNIKEFRIENFLNKLISVGEEINADDIEAELIDKDDIPFYKAFLKKKKTENLVFLVTGNKKHFPINQFILSPREFYELIENIRYLNNLC